jgi:hypothetical protein
VEKIGYSGEHLSPVEGMCERSEDTCEDSPITRTVLSPTRGASYLHIPQSILVSVIHVVYGPNPLAVSILVLACLPSPSYPEVEALKYESDWKQSAIPTPQRLSVRGRLPVSISHRNQPIHVAWGNNGRQRVGSAEAVRMQ